ncbi:replication protein A 70 kDa DNA-binding subunit C-like protein [Tanacetum coccineum]
MGCFTDSLVLFRNNLMEGCKNDVPNRGVDCKVEAAHNKYLIDIAGYVTNVGRTSYTKTGSKTLEFYLANQRGQSLRVTLWGQLGDVLVEKKTRHAGVCAMVLTGMSVKEYNNKLYLSSTSSTVFCDDDDIPCLQELRADDSFLDATALTFAFAAATAAPSAVAPMWAPGRASFIFPYLHP